MNDLASTKTPLLPPRPNLGPEPLTETSLSSPLMLFAMLATLLAGSVLAAILLRRRGRRLAAARPGVARSLSASNGPATPGDRLIALSPSIRAALTRRFGPTYLAKTTEELATDVRIGEVLGQPDLLGLIEILNAIDRHKFAPVLAPDDGTGLADDVAAWESSVAQLTKALDSRRAEKMASRAPVAPYGSTIWPGVNATPSTSA